MFEAIDKRFPVAYLHWRQSTVTEFDNAATGDPLRACPISAPLAMHRIYPAYCIRKNIGVAMLVDNVPLCTGQPIEVAGATMQEAVTKVAK